MQPIPAASGSTASSETGASSEPGASGAAALALHWQLDRVLRECWEDAGIPGDEARRGTEIILALLARMKQTAAVTSTNGNLDVSYKDPGALGAEIILENYEAADFRKILGVNRFEDVTWFNKEAFDETLSLVPCFLSLEEEWFFGKNQDDRQKRVKTIAAVTEAFRQAEAASEYRLDTLPVIMAAAKPKTVNVKSSKKKNTPNSSKKKK